MMRLRSFDGTKFHSQQQQHTHRVPDIIDEAEVNALTHVGRQQRGGDRERNPETHEHHVLGRESEDATTTSRRTFRLGVRHTIFSHGMKMHSTSHPGRCFVPSANAIVRIVRVLTR